MSWWQLDSIIRMQAEFEAYYLTQEPVACPSCGEPLLPGPPQLTGVVSRYCPWGHFRYPEDWNPRTMSGM